MTICSTCCKKFPDIATNGIVCGICALLWTRSVHNDPSLIFEGEIALEIYELAVKYAKRKGWATE